MAEQMAEAFGGASCYACLDLFVSFDQRLMHEDSRDYTTFQSPLGTLRLTRIPMGWTNSPQIMHGDSNYILKDEIPHVTIPFVDDINAKGPPTRYELPDGGYETIPENPGIRRFVWEHLNNVNRILQRYRYIGGTFNGKKLLVCEPSVIIVGHKCTYEGRVPIEDRVQKVRDWPVPTTVTEVRSFLGTCGLMRIFIKGFAMAARPLVQLTRKGVPFRFEEEEQLAFDHLKDAIATSQALRALDYEHDWEVILAVDSSVIGVGFILMQKRNDEKRYPSRFGSIAWSERESRYSQAKLELYGLFRALRNLRVWIIGIRNLTVEVDAKYIKGMLNNPDFQPNATINRWIAGILLFDFKLVHVPGTQHAAADGLSRRPHAEEDPPEPDDPEDWIDESYGFFMELIHFRPSTQVSHYRTLCFLCQMNSPEPPLNVIQVLHGEVPEPDSEEIPRSEKARAADDRVALAEAFLRNFKRPQNISESDFPRFTKFASEFFILDDRLWRRDRHGKHKLYVKEGRRLILIRQVHDALGHKGVFAVRTHLLDRFWWPYLDHDVKWYVRSCHECQVRQQRYFQIPPTVATPLSLFRKAYVDTMFMPRAGGFRYIVQARCSLTSYPEFRMLRKETGATLGAFIFEELLCRWGALEEIVTDNGKPFLEALNWLANKYGITHIRISPYNSQANGPVERRHLDVREAIMKTCDGEEHKWYTVVHSVFWAERVTVQKRIGYSPYYMAHGVEPLLPFDLSEVTYMVPTQDKMTTPELIAIRARQLQKRQQDLDDVKKRVLKARFASAKDFEKKHGRTIKNFDFQQGDLVLVRNSRIEMSMDRKAKPRWFGPMVVVKRHSGGAYQLAELDGAVSTTRFAAFRVVPYYPRKAINITNADFFVFPEPVVLQGIDEMTKPDHSQHTEYDSDDSASTARPEHDEDSD
jgi:hypothetical protein